MIAIPNVVVLPLDGSAGDANTGIEVGAEGYGIYCAGRVENLYVAFERQSNPRYRLNEGDEIRPGGLFSKFYIFRSATPGSVSTRRMAELVVLPTADATFRRRAEIPPSYGSIHVRYTSATCWRAVINNKDPQDTSQRILRVLALRFAMVTAASRVLIRVGAGDAYAAIGGAAVANPVWWNGFTGDRPVVTLESLDIAAPPAASPMSWYYWLDSAVNGGNLYIPFGEANDSRGAALQGLTTLRVQAMAAGAFDIAMTAEIMGRSDVTGSASGG